MVSTLIFVGCFAAIFCVILIYHTAERLGKWLDQDKAKPHHTSLDYKDGFAGKSAQPQEGLSFKQVLLILFVLFVLIKIIAC
jgi:hypothetical protein